MQAAASKLKYPVFTVLFSFRCSDCVAALDKPQPVFIQQTFYKHGDPEKVFPEQSDGRAVFGARCPGYLAAAAWRRKGRDRRTFRLHAFVATICRRCLRVCTLLSRFFGKIMNGKIMILPFMILPVPHFSIGLRPGRAVKRLGRQAARLPRPFTLILERAKHG